MFMKFSQNILGTNKYLLYMKISKIYFTVNNSEL